MSDLSQFFAEKKKLRTKLLRENPGNKHSRAIIINCIHNTELRNFINHACREIDVLCLENGNSEFIAGADGFVSDQDQKSDVFEKFLSEGIVPILPSNNPYSHKEFNPMKFEGYGYFFVENKPFQMFEKICRLVENLNYPGDRRTLIKNILEKFSEK